MEKAWRVNNNLELLCVCFYKASFCPRQRRVWGDSYTLMPDAATLLRQDILSHI